MLYYRHQSEKRRLSDIMYIVSLYSSVLKKCIYRFSSTKKKTPKKPWMWTNIYAKVFQHWQWRYVQQATIQMTCITPNPQNEHRLENVSNDVENYVVSLKHFLPNIFSCIFIAVPLQINRKHCVWSFCSNYWFSVFLPGFMGWEFIITDTIYIPTIVLIFVVVITFRTVGLTTEMIEQQP